tara:strand:+ start:3163 stop:3447 length:285 start_codon:yes stop_codon:yes gene_type:complete
MSECDPMLCIPRVSNEIKKKYIIEKINKLNWGIIKLFNEIPLSKEKDYKRIMIKLDWNRDDETLRYKEKIKNEEVIKVVYDENSPWFWRINKFK